MNKLQISNLSGPTITGTVTVNLKDLDQMRLDHANALKLAQELSDKQMSVKVTIVERSHGVAYSSNRYVSDTKYEELGIEYKNMEDFRSMIALEERGKLTNELNKLNSEINRQAKKVGDLEVKLTNCDEERKKEVTKNTLLVQESALLEKINKNQEQQINDLGKIKNELTTINETQRTHIKKYMEQAHKWRKAKTFWYKIFG